MKNLLIILLAVLLPQTIFSQNLSIGKFKILKFGASFGVERDMIQGLDGNYLLATAKDVEVDIPDGLTFSTNSYLSICENPIVNLFAVLEVPKLKNTELQLGINVVIGRLDEAYYSNEGNYSEVVNNYPQYDFLSITSFSNEVGVDIGLSRRFALRKNFNFYLGAGTNLGLSYQGDVEINGSDLSIVKSNQKRDYFDVWTGEYRHNYNYNSFEFKKAFHQRLVLQTGVSIVALKRLEFGFFVKGGMGYKAHFNGPRKSTRLMGSGFSAKWLLKDS